MNMHMKVTTRRVHGFRPACLPPKSLQIKHALWIVVGASVALFLRALPRGTLQPPGDAHAPPQYALVGAGVALRAQNEHRARAHALPNAHFRQQPVAPFEFGSIAQPGFPGGAPKHGSHSSSAMPEMPVPVLKKAGGWAKKRAAAVVDHPAQNVLANSPPVSLHSHASDGSHRLVWLLHFHKAAGTSFTTLASINGERKRTPPRVPNAPRDPHSHLELNTAPCRGIRWPLVAFGAGAGTIPSGCTIDMRCRGKVDEPKSLGAEIASLKERGVTFVSTEHWFPTPKVLATEVPDGVALVVVFRDPIDRLLSSYFFHGCAGNRCRGKGGHSCGLAEWAPTEANMMTRMLGAGGVFGPSWVREDCTRMYADAPVENTTFHAAAHALRRFDLVLTFDSLFGEHQAAAECAIKHVLGWNITALPKMNQNRIHEAQSAWVSKAIGKRCKSNPAVTKEDIAGLLKPNAWDVKLYDKARQRQSEIFRELGC